MFDGMVASYPATYLKLVKDIKPDFILFDQLFPSPIGIDQNIKWGNLFSAAMNYVSVFQMTCHHLKLVTYSLFSKVLTLKYLIYFLFFFL